MTDIQTGDVGPGAASKVLVPDLHRPARSAGASGVFAPCLDTFQRKVLTPNDFPNPDSVAERLLDFQYYWESAAKPFEWKFKRQDLNDLLSKLNTPR